jgi:4-hydroxy-4-methyl-2-oxoglutarate aldolase
MIGQSGNSVRNVTRADPAAVAELSKYSVATIHEAMSRSGLMASYMRPIYPGAKASGTVVTVFAHPGDVIMADDDGVVVIPKAQADKVAAASAAREAKEAGTRKRLAAAELGLDVYGMREPLAKAGLKYFEDEAAYLRELQR